METLKQQSVLVVDTIAGEVRIILPNTEDLGSCGMELEVDTVPCSCENDDVEIIQLHFKDKSD